MRNSKVDTKRTGKLDVPYAPTFYPTIEDMEGNPLDYVEKIRPQAEKYGIFRSNTKPVPGPHYDLYTAHYLRERVKIYNIRD